MRTVLLVTALAAVACARHVTVLEYSSDDGATWHPKADVTVDDTSVTGSSDVTQWRSEDMGNFRKGASYRLRLRDPAAGDAIVAAVTLSPCSLLTAKVYAALPMKSTLERIAIVAHDGKASGIRQQTPFVDAVCELNTFSTTNTVAHRVTIVRAGATPTPAQPPMPDAPRGASPGVGADGKPAPGGKAGDAPEEDKRTFWEKYWLYIIMFLGYTVVSSILAPQPKEGGAQGGAKPKAE